MVAETSYNNLDATIESSMKNRRGVRSVYARVVTSGCHDLVRYTEDDLTKCTCLAVLLNIERKKSNRKVLPEP